jgi:hypothetical protein
VDSTTIGVALLLIALLLAVIGAGFLLAPHILLAGHLPGDVSFERGGFSFYLPVVTCIVLSIVLTAAANIAIRICR